MTDFVQEEERVLSGVGRIRLVFEDWGQIPPADPMTGQAQPRYQGSFEVQLLDQNGAVMREKSGDVQPYLTASQKTTIKNLQDAFRVKAEKLIPPV
jgi:hypothetical protein